MKNTILNVNESLEAASSLNADTILQAMARRAPAAIRGHSLRTLAISILQMQTRVTGQGLANTT